MRDTGGSMMAKLDPHLQLELLQLCDNVRAGLLYAA
jgi:hypothetical protein